LAGYQYWLVSKQGGDLRNSKIKKVNNLNIMQKLKAMTRL
jgi:hypothetical protein